MEMVYFTFKLILILTLGNVVYSDGNGSQKFSRDGHQCFCKLKGEVDDCSCKVETLDSLNNNKIYPRLRSLLTRNYFRYFKLNLQKDCPYWTDDSRCALKDCHVDTCSEDDIPPALVQQEKQNKYKKEAQEEPHSCKEERELSALDTTISEENKEVLRNWTRHDESQDLFCEIDDETATGLEYVDLKLNPERYTGYKGASPHRIWRSIYEENCFKPQPDVGYGPKEPLSSLCLEKRTFYRMISGLHTSINIHLCADYFKPEIGGFGSGTWGPNSEEFKKRFGPETSNGEGPQRLKNLYFTYLVILRAIAKAAPYLSEENYYTGDSEEDQDVKKGMVELLEVVRSFKDHFEESKLFTGASDDARKLKEEFRNHFRNISRIMDCVGCDKCKLWGKLQTQGMGTALKILFSGDSVKPESTVDARSKKNFQLTRTEIVALLNGFGRLSSSIHSLEMFRSLLR